MAKRSQRICFFKAGEGEIEPSLFWQICRQKAFIAFKMSNLFVKAGGLFIVTRDALLSSSLANVIL
ncbi:hypothetical protein CEV08_08065 [Bartonella tribocorum]|uniref:Uncharacterized protein n=1 Tax=Bartonella tribocorum TaxID=85701 RepID=A0A2M6UQI0_9HYPH|nr:hypothetical protein CEV08_08065 [Bartonella tribocorum]